LPHTRLLHGVESAGHAYELKPGIAAQDTISSISRRSPSFHPAAHDNRAGISNLVPLISYRKGGVERLPDAESCPWV
jgi:hypothetical protein